MGGRRRPGRRRLLPSEEATPADRGWMRRAMALARRAGGRGEVPVGAVVVLAGRVAGAAGNRSIAGCDPTAHAEMRALRAAARRVGNHRLLGATLVTTLEPCVMCMGAMIHARVGRLVFGARDPKGGAAVSCFALADDRHLNHRVAVVEGVAADESAALLRAFFVARRARGSRDR